MTTENQSINAQDVASDLITIIGFPPEISQSGAAPTEAADLAAGYLKATAHLVAAPGNWIRRTSWPAGTRVEYGDDTAFMVSGHADPHPWNSAADDTVATDWETGSAE